MSEEVTRLEEKIAYLERHVTEQDKAMLEFAEDLARLRREIKTLTGRISSAPTAGPDERGPEEDRPPHY